MFSSVLLPSPSAEPSLVTSADGSDVELEAIDCSVVVDVASLLVVDVSADTPVVSCSVVVISVVVSILLLIVVLSLPLPGLVLGLVLILLEEGSLVVVDGSGEVVVVVIAGAQDAINSKMHLRLTRSNAKRRLH